MRKESSMRPEIAAETLHAPMHTQQKATHVGKIIVSNNVTLDGVMQAPALLLGRRLFAEDESFTLRLPGSRATGNGAVIATYRPVESLLARCS